MSARERARKATTATKQNNDEIGQICGIGEGRGGEIAFFHLIYIL
jgi:hypothetical protein